MLIERRKDNMINKKVILFKFIIFIIILRLIFPIEVIALNKIDSNKTGELNIILENIDCNIKVNLYYIKEISDFSNLKYKFTDSFSGMVLEDNVSDLEYAIKLNDYIKQNNIAGIQLFTNKNGEVNFKNLKLGMYLITIDTFYYNEKNYTVNPFLIEIPQPDQEIEWNYIITAYPKIFEKIENDEKNDSQENINVSENILENKLPETGILVWPIPILAFIGLLFLLIGYFLYIKKDNENE